MILERQMNASESLLLLTQNFCQGFYFMVSFVQMLKNTQKLKTFLKLQPMSLQIVSLHS